MTAPDPHVPVVRLAGYEVLEPIARGGMGVVFKARQAALDRVVALKVMIAGEHGTAETLERFRREAKAAARLDHPHIVPIYDVGQEGPTHFFTMQLIEGEALSSLVQRRAVTPRRAMEIAAKIARALEYAHAQGILHRDVKPGNILVDRSGEPRLADFGLAKDVSSGALTAPGSFLGTVNYASPEQIEGEASRIGPPTDVYSLGATLYEALTGRPPFAGESAFDVVSKVMNDDPLPPGAINPEVRGPMEAVCLKALERDPGRRYASAGAMAADLERFLAGEAIEAVRSGTWTRGWRWVGRRRGATAAVAASVLVVAGILGWLAWDARRTSRAEAAQAEEAARLRCETALDALLRAEREAALRAGADAEALIAKSERVSAVLARWRRFEDATAVDLAAFLGSTPTDSASKATASALAGWAEHQSGNRAAAGEFWRIAREADPDIPYAALMEALATFAEYVEQQPMPIVYAGPDGLTFTEVPPETTEMARLRGRIESLAGEAEKARVWGKESAADFRVALAAVRSMHAGKLDDAEQGLTQALTSPDLRAFEAGLFFARAHARYLRMGFLGALEDAAEVVRARPTWAKAHFHLAEVTLAVARKEGIEGKDPRERMRATIAAYEEALKIEPRTASTLNNLGVAWQALGDAEIARGADPRESYRQAIACYERLDRLWEASPVFLEGQVNRGIAHAALGHALVARGEDPREEYSAAIRAASAVIEADRSHWLALNVRGGTSADPREEVRLAIADYDQAIRRDPATPQVRANRAQALVDLAQAEATHGGDPARWYREAIEECARGLERNREHAEFYAVRALAWYGLGSVEVAAGRDPSEAFAKAIAGMGEVIDRNPSNATLYNNRGGVRFYVAGWESSTGRDPRETLARAVDDFSSAIRINHAYAEAYFNRGFAHMEIGKAAQLRGKDPREAYCEALADYDAALERNPSHWMAHANRACVCEALGRWDDAETSYLAVEKLVGSRPDVTEALARVRKAKGGGGK